jgi:hypothetical protein
MDNSFPQRVNPQHHQFGRSASAHPLANHSHVAQSAYAHDQWKPKAYNYFMPDYNPSRTQDNFQHNSDFYVNPNYACPTCFSGKKYFTLKNELTNTVYCSNCRQPFHHCPMDGHEKPIAGVGYREESQMGQNCQCVAGGQEFLDDNQWNSCFRK